ncbi:MAG: glycoside hydrolase family 2 protein [Prolixibacteraceae bacterium]
MRTILFIAVIVALVGCKGNQNQKIEINSGWEFAIVGDEDFKPATVPGYVHTDLLTNGIIDSLYWGENPKKYNFVGDTSWVYKTTFILSKEQISYNTKVLQFEGLDTYTDVFLNGEKILVTDNMFLAYEKNVTSYLNEGENQLEILFKSVRKEGQKIVDNYKFYTEEHARADADNYRKFVRKAQYQFGWDWACPLVPAGIYKPINLILYNSARINDVFIVQEELEDDLAKLKAEIEIASNETTTVDLQVEVNQTIVKTLKNVSLNTGSNNLYVDFEIENPQLWWTNGAGEQPLYNIAVNVVKDGIIHDTKLHKIGLRTIEFVNDWDEQGRSYYFKVNGEPIFMKGANYVPIDAMLPTVTKERYDEFIAQCVEANFNMIRIWGGGIYENEEFYDACDAAGILIYQDFMFASFMPPADDPFMENLEKEAIYQVKRLRNRACMALWAGSNEVESAWFEGYMPKGYPEEVYTIDHKKIFDKLLPSVVKKYHPGIGYVRSSPTTGTDSIMVNTRGYGDAHAWGVWFAMIDFNKAKFGRLTRFISEYGFVGYPAYTSLKKYMPVEEMDTTSAVFQFRDAYIGIQDNIRNFIDRYYPQPRNMMEWTYVSGIMQGEAMRQSNEIYRTHMPYCMGALLWQLNDVWPVASWAMLDYYQQWKPVMYRTKESFAPIIVSIYEDKGQCKLYGVSDEFVDREVELILSLKDFYGKEISRYSKNHTLEANTSTEFHNFSYKDILNGEDAANVVLEAVLLENNDTIASTLHYINRPKDLKLNEANVSYEVKEENGKTVVEVSTDYLAKNLYLIDSKGEINFSNNYFDLMPNRKVKVYPRKEIGADELRKRLSILTLNEILIK